MVETGRSERRRFIDALGKGGGAWNSTVFRASEACHPAGYIRVDFDLEWPSSSHPSRSEAGLARDAVVGKLYRVKVMLEQTLMQELLVYDVVIGCLKVRYALTQPASEATVRRAINRLLPQKEVYCVTAASGHLNGRAVALGHGRAIAPE